MLTRWLEKMAKTARPPSSGLALANSMSWGTYTQADPVADGEKKGNEREREREVVRVRNGYKSVSTSVIIRFNSATRAQHALVRVRGNTPAGCAEAYWDMIARVRWLLSIVSRKLVRALKWSIPLSSHRQQVPVRVAPFLSEPTAHPSYGNVSRAVHTQSNV